MCRTEPHLGVQTPQATGNYWLSGILRGWSVGLPNLLGAMREEPEQVRDSNTLTTPSPKDPNYFNVISIC